MSSTERRPTPASRGWDERPAPASVRGPGVLAASAWRRGDITVISTLVLAEYPTGEGVGEQYHVSIARGAKRARPKDLEIAQRAFRCRGWEEDNHHPGAAHHFWLPLDPAHRATCQCKSSETVVVDPRDGYTWTNPRDPAEGCRGCEMTAINGAACPIHGAA